MFNLLTHCTPCKDNALTSRDAVNVVLDQEVDHGDQRAKEGVGKELSVLHGLWVLGCRLDGADNVRDGAEQVHNHRNVVDVMIVRRCHKDPSSTSDTPEHIVGEKKLCEALGSRGRDIASGQEVPEEAKNQART